MAPAQDRQTSACCCACLGRGISGPDGHELIRREDCDPLGHPGLGVGAVRGEAGSFGVADQFVVDAQINVFGVYRRL